MHRRMGSRAIKECWWKAQQMDRKKKLEVIKKKLEMLKNELCKQPSS
jgi:hypothetical protein